MEMFPEDCPGGCHSSSLRATRVWGLEEEKAMPACWCELVGGTQGDGEELSPPCQDSLSTQGPASSGQARGQRPAL